MKKQIFIAAAVSISSTLHAQDSTMRLNEVVVTATKYPLKQSLTGKVLTVISREQLEKNSGRSLSDLLNVQVGLLVNGTSNTLGTNQDIYMRGAAAGKTLILVDGVPVYDVSGISGAFDLNLLALDQVERVEILKGSQSTLYGSDAIAGVINIITKKGGAKKINGDVSLAGGSYGTFKTGVGINGTIDKTSYNVQFNTINSAGFSSAHDVQGNGNFDKDGFDQTVARINVDQKINNKLGFRLVSQLSRYKTDVDAGKFVDDPDYTATNKNALIGIGADYNYGKGVLHLNYNFNKIQRDYLNDSTALIGFSYYSKGKYVGKSHFWEAYSNIGLNKKADLLVGADYRQQSTEQEYFSVSAFGPFSSPTIEDSARVNQIGAYASVIVKDIKGFNVELGGRYNNFNKYGDVFTFSFNPSYNINERVKLFANASSGFKTPSLYQVYSEYKPSVGELKPERSMSFEGGLQYAKENVNLRAVYFLRNIKDNIVFLNNNNAPSYGEYANADKQKDKGFEFEASIDLGKLTLYGNYTNVDGYVETKVGNKDTLIHNLYRRPRQAINLNAMIAVCKGWSLNIGVQSIGKRFEYNAAPIEMPSYYTWNIYSEYKVGKRVKLFADLRNMTDEEYFEIQGYNSRRFNVMAGATIKF